MVKQEQKANLITKIWAEMQATYQKYIEQILLHR